MTFEADAPAIWVISPPSGHTPVGYFMVCLLHDTCDYFTNLITYIGRFARRGAPSQFILIFSCDRYIYMFAHCWVSGVSGEAPYLCHAHVIYLCVIVGVEVV